MIFSSAFLRRLISSVPLFCLAVGEHIELRIRRDTTYDEILKEEKTQMIREAIKTSPLELTKLDETGNTIDLSIQCTGKIAYSHFIEEDGPIVLITKTLFSMASPSLVRLSVLLDSSILNDVENDQGNNSNVIQKRYYSTRT